MNSIREYLPFTSVKGAVQLFLGVMIVLLVMRFTGLRKYVA